MKKNKLILAVGSVALSAAGLNTAHADAGDTISNRATVNYQVNSVSQAVIESSPTGNTTPGATNGANTDFIEDRLINFVITREDANEIPISPNVNGDITAASTTVLTYRVTNNGNGCQDFALTPSNQATSTANPFGGTADSFDVAGVSAFVNSVQNDAAATFDGNGTDSGTFIDELCGGDFVRVFVVPTGTPSIANGTANGSIAVANLSAQVAQGDSAGGAVGTSITADDSAALDIPSGAGAEQIVFTTAVNAGSGALDVDNAFQVLAAELVVTKQSIVSSASTDQQGTPTIGDNLSVVTDVALGALDDDTLTHGTAKRVPGAVVAYAIEVQNEDSALGNNNDAADAANVFVVDDFSALIPGDFAQPTNAPANITATLIRPAGTSSTITFVTADPTGDFFGAGGALHAAGDIVYDTTNNVAYGLCGTLRGNDNGADPDAGANTDEACRLVVNLTAQ